MTNRPLLILLGVGLAASAGTAQKAATPPLLVRAGTVLPVEGRPLPGGAVLVEEGRIAAVGRDLESPPGVRVLAFDRGFLVPGLVDGGSWLGIYRERNENTEALLPDLRVADSLDPFDPGFRAALEAGITTLHLVPGDEDVVGGQTAIVRVDASGRARILREAAGVKVSLVARSFEPRRAPTSAAGAYGLLAETSGHPVLEELRAGRRRAFVSVERDVEIELAARLAGESSIRGVLIAGPAVRNDVAGIAARHAGVLLRPLVPAMLPVERRAAADLVAGGVRLGFSSLAPAYAPGALRLSAVVARAAGLDPGAALRALTLDTARLLGAEDRVGSLVAGKEADLVVFSHHPTDPRARVMLVVAGGAVAHHVGGTR